MNIGGTQCIYQSILEQNVYFFADEEWKVTFEDGKPPLYTDAGKQVTKIEVTYEGTRKEMLHSSVIDLRKYAKNSFMLNVNMIDFWQPRLIF